MTTDHAAWGYTTSTGLAFTAVDIVDGHIEGGKARRLVGRAAGPERDARRLRIRHPVAARVVRIERPAKQIREELLDLLPVLTDDLGMDEERLNVHGGAIALGHPFGSTGTRIMTTLLNGLEERDGQLGLETMCVGGGQGMAIIVERLA